MHHLGFWRAKINQKTLVDGARDIKNAELALKIQANWPYFFAPYCV